MRILEELRREHRLIESVAGALVTFVERERGAGDEDALASFCDFFSAYADARHHAIEEEILFSALREVELPERGPIAQLRGEHADSRSAVAELRATTDHAALVARARRFCARLWEHIDKEESVLFPEVEVRLALERARLDREFAARERDPARRDALASLGASLASRFPPRTELSGFTRGEGCSACRHFGDTCEGVEREWWSEAEWEGFHARDF